MSASKKQLHWAHVKPESLPKVTPNEKKILAVIQANKLVTTRKVELETKLVRRSIDSALGNLYRKGYIQRHTDVYPQMWEYILGAE